MEAADAKTVAPSKLIPVKGIEYATGVVVAVALFFVVRGTVGDLASATLGGFAAIVALGLYDLRTGLINRQLVYAATSAVLVTTAIISAIAGEWGHLASAAAAAALSVAIMLPFWIARGIGSGDVRLAALVGAVIGPYGLVSALFTLALGLFIAAPIGLYLRHKTGESSQPLGPGIALATALTLLLI